MKLPWRSRHRAPIVVSESESDPPRPAVTAYRSPGLEAAVQRLPDRDSCQVLDLGPAVEDNVAFLGNLARRLQILDLGRQRPGDRQETAASLERDIALLRELLPAQAGAFHLVMAWDILNYVPRQRFKELMGVLSELCAPEARLFSMICESKTMSAAPNRYRVVRESRIVAESQTSDVKVAPEMPPAAVERVLAGFRIEHSFVLRHGVREYVAAKAKTAR